MITLGNLQAFKTLVLFKRTKKLVVMFKPFNYRAHCKTTCFNLI